MNRDLSKVIIVDWNKDAYKFNPENGFNLKPWKGEEDDVVLGELADFLRGDYWLKLPKQPRKEAYLDLLSADQFC